MEMGICYVVERNSLFQRSYNLWNEVDEYNTKVNFDDKTFTTIDFKTGDRYIEVIDSEADLTN